MESQLVHELQNRFLTNLISGKVLFHSRVDMENIGHVVKKNNRPIHSTGGRPFIGKSTKLVKAEQHLLYHLTREKMKLGIVQPIQQDVWCLFIFYFTDYFVKAKKKGDPPRRSRTLGDLSNLYQLPEDCLVQAGIISDDSYICSHDGSRRAPSQTGRDYLDIFVLQYPNDPQH